MAKLPRRFQAVRERAGHDAEVPEGIGPDRAAVTLEIAGAVLKVAGREFGQLRGEPGAHGDHAAVVQRRCLLRHLVGAGHQPDTVGRMLERLHMRCLDCTKPLLRTWSRFWGQL